MAYTKITLKNEENGRVKIAPLGFSWTSLFFGWLVPLLRGDMSWAAWLIFGALTAFLSNIYQAFVYNKAYIKDLIKKGFKVSETTIPIEELSKKIKIDLPSI